MYIGNAGRNAGGFRPIIDNIADKWVSRQIYPFIGFHSVQIYITDKF